MLRCPSCGADVPAGFAFCGRCGVPLGPGPGVEERRVVTVLFCDLVGFTARAVLAEAAGDLEAAAGRYDDAAGRWDGFGVVLEHGQALLGLGRCAARLGRAPGRDRLLQARRIFDRLGAPGLLAETDHWLPLAC